MDRDSQRSHLILPHTLWLVSQTTFTRYPSQKVETCTVDGDSRGKTSVSPHERFPSFCLRTKTRRQQTGKGLLLESTYRTTLRDGIDGVLKRRSSLSARVKVLPRGDTTTEVLGVT